MNTDRRQLNQTEIAILQQQGCKSKGWDEVYISPQTQLHYLQNVEFIGQIELGATGSLVNSETGLTRYSGIYNAKLINCSIGDHCYIANIGADIANYHIHDHAYIENVHILATTQKSSFGNGTRVTVINESGGRMVPIYAELNAQIAFIFTCFPEKTEMCSHLSDMVDEFTKEHSFHRGTIGKHVRIENCGSIRNVMIGEYAKLNGVANIENGTILGSKSQPVFIGVGVIAKDFIIQEGSILDSFAIIDKCFVGQGVKIAKQFSAENCCIFANSEMLHGEACSIFAGPFTVSHHKSTLLIAGMYSFYNAGSGTNFSNHMYKLGPIHQGILHRGCKNGSDSYLLWPSQIGAFTSIIGRHKTHMDTHNFPFSILLNKEQSILLPGQNLSSIGTIRDAAKWPKRDTRDAENKRDLVHFNLLNAYTIHLVNTGLQSLLELSKIDQKSFLVNGVQLSKAAIKRGISVYRDAISIFCSRIIARQLHNRDLSENWQQRLQTKSHINCDHWIDMAGMLIPRLALDIIFDKIQKREINTLDQLRKSLYFMYTNYPEFETSLAEKLLQETLQKSIQDVETIDIILILKNGAQALQQQLTRLKADAKKEFIPAMHIGYAVDKNAEQTAFKYIHGSVDDHAFLATLEDDIQNEINVFEDLAAQLEV